MRPGEFQNITQNSEIQDFSRISQISLKSWISSVLDRYLGLPWTHQNDMRGYQNWNSRQKPSAMSYLTRDMILLSFLVPNSVQKTIFNQSCRKLCSISFLVFFWFYFTKVGVTPEVTTSSDPLSWYLSVQGSFFGTCLDFFARCVNMKTLFLQVRPGTAPLGKCSSNWRVWRVGYVGVRTKSVASRPCRAQCI